MPPTMIKTPMTVGSSHIVPPRPAGPVALTGLLVGDAYEKFLDERAALNKKYPEVKATFEDYMEQILYAIKLVGVDHVGFGADWDGGGGVAGYEDILMLPKITDRLLKEGYTEADLQKMWGGNVVRLLKVAEDYKASLKK